MGTNVEGLVGVENTDREEMVGLVTDLTHAVYPHQQIYGDYCPIQGYIECPPEKVFEYMANPLSLAEWTYSMRDFRKVNDEGLFVGAERLVDDTEIYFKVVANREALTVDYHCAWDQGDELWMIYLNRIVPAELVLKRPGSVVFWQNCRHPNYQQNPYPERSSPERAWVGQYWDFFYGGHTVELGNLKKILEHRHARGEPVTPRVRLQEAR